MARLSHATPLDVAITEGLGCGAAAAAADLAADGSDDVDAQSRSRRHHRHVRALHRARYQLPRVKGVTNKGAVERYAAALDLITPGEHLEQGVAVLVAVEHQEARHGFLDDVGPELKRCLPAQRSMAAMLHAESSACAFAADASGINNGRSRPRDRQHRTQPTFGRYRSSHTFEQNSRTGACPHCSPECRRARST